LAQKTLRHKTAKRSFQRIFMATALINCFVMLAGLFLLV
ncbi:MAG: hypothetical protein JWQ00_143, partial [Noviherbaspirillum sp.]|nr:hypothetical protein [Noviherbaspirillum sp.]